MVRAHVCAHVRISAVSRLLPNVRPHLRGCEGRARGLWGIPAPRPQRALPHLPVATAPQRSLPASGRAPAPPCVSAALGARFPALGRAPPEPRGPMAKRRAPEPLTFQVPWKRLLLCDFPEEPPPPPLWIPPPGVSHPGQPLGVPELPRKRRIDSGAMTEPSASPSKRRDGGEPSAPGGAEPERCGLETGEPPLLQPPEQPRGPGEGSRGARPPRGSGDEGAGRAEAPQGDWGPAPRQLNEEFWQYNTFQYWRNPLPPIDLADIEGVNEDNLTEARLQCKNEVVEIDMES